MPSPSPAPPTISGALADLTTSHEAALSAFLTVTLADPNATTDPGIDDALTIALTGAGGYLVEAPAYTGLAILDRNGAGYTLTGTAGEIQTALQNLEFVSNAGTADAPATTDITLALHSTLNGAVLASSADTTIPVTDSDPIEAPLLALAPTPATTTWEQTVAPSGARRSSIPTRTRRRR